MEISEKNSFDNYKIEDENRREKLMDKLNINDNEILEENHSKNEIAQLPLLKRIEKKHTINVDEILKAQNKGKDKKRKFCNPKENDDIEIEQPKEFKKKKKGWLERKVNK